MLPKAQLSHRTLWSTSVESAIDGTPSTCHRLSVLGTKLGHSAILTILNVNEWKSVYIDTTDSDSANCYCSGHNISVRISDQRSVAKSCLLRRIESCLKNKKHQQCWSDALHSKVLRSLIGWRLAIQTSSQYSGKALGLWLIHTYTMTVDDPLGGWNSRT